MTSVLHAVNGYIPATHLGHISSRGPLPVHNFTTLTTNTSTPGNAIAFCLFLAFLFCRPPVTALPPYRNRHNNYRYTHTLEQHQNRFTRPRAHYHQETLGKVIHIEEDKDSFISLSKSTHNSLLTTQFSSLGRKPWPSNGSVRASYLVIIGIIWGVSNAIIV
jgi:hypothetical protein